ncbi:MAG: SDR family NAD(P)-dependent oxidoreductase [Candidatus Binatia bacterium]
MNELRGMTALVTGAAKRIGREIALGLAAEGVNCLLHYNRSPEQIAETAEACREIGVQAEAIQADFLSLEAVERLGQEAAARGVEIFVHNASTFSRTPFFETPLEEHRRVLERDLRVHVTAPYLLARMLGDRMVERGFGRIVVIGDWTGEAAVYRNYAPYIVSKSAVPALVKVLALELGARAPGVTANAVLPGPILAPDGQDPADVASVPRQAILGEWVGPEDVVRAVLFLAASRGITGAAIRVDGGRSTKAL